tara:strand:+ start:436 stop:2934 length:2499 start_codon:yes stop_codon:yes gene_type:complete
MAFRGLNVQLAMNDVDSASQALINLGLDQRDLALISKLADPATDLQATELHTASGLVVDQKKELASLARSSTTVGNLLNNLKDIGQPLDFNLQIDNQIQAAAIKYKYLDFSNNALKTADISTSRVSSWSTIGDSIVYGGEVRVAGDTLTLSSLATSQAPIPKLFRAEIANTKVKIKINGGDVEFLAMKGIPLEWDAFFRNADLRHAVTSVSDSAGVIPPVWRITNKAGGQSYNTGNATGSIGSGSVGTPATYPFRDSSSKARKVEFFYDPIKIKELRLTSLNLSKWTNVGLDSLERIDISQNDFYELPKFGPASRGGDALAIGLQHITLTGNNLSRAQDASGVQITANTQLNTLPTTLTHLTMNGVFSDSTTIDLTDYENLNTMTMHSYYSRNAQRRMTGGSISPKTFIDSANPKVKGVTSYFMYHQPYPFLDEGVCESPNLTSISFSWCGTQYKENRSNPSSVTDPITIASTNIVNFSSTGNPHNVVNMSSKASLTDYVQQYSRPGGSQARSILSRFTGCSSLTRIYLYQSSGLNGSIQGAFANQGLSALSTIELRYSGCSGELRDSSFTGVPSLANFLVAGGGFGASSSRDFFGTTDSINNNAGNGEVFKECPNLSAIYAYNNGNIGGPLPDFSANTALRVLYLHATSLNGSLPNLASNQSLYYLRGSNCAFSGPVPLWTTNALHYVFLYGNSISGSLPAIQTPYLYYLYLQYNSITGNLPSMAGAIRLQRLYLNSNGLTGYTPEALKYNSNLRIIDLSNNSLPSGASSTLINDLFDNYAINPRSGVSVNLLGNQGLNRTSIINDGTGDGENSTISKLTFLERFWTILLD